MHTRPLAFCLALLLVVFGQVCHAEVQRRKFSAANAYLVVEILDDRLIHCEISAIGPGPATSESLYASPMVLKRDYTGPTAFIDSGSVLETSDLRIEVDPTTLALSIRDKTRANALLTTIRAQELDNPSKRLQIDRGSMQNAYGLGQQFVKVGSSEGDWTSHGVREGGAFGNTFAGFQSGAVGNVQIPVMYAVGANNLNYALFLDNVYRQRWDFTTPVWEVRMFGDQIRFYVMTGPDLPHLRADYLTLTGTPPVPPRKAFGMWVSEFGYDNWDQIETLRKGLRAGGFPVDGFVLDLNWFGGVVPGKPAESRMGRLNWDESDTDGNGYFFPDPAGHIRALDADHLRLAAIEESYVANTTDTFGQMPADLAVFQRTGGVCDASNQSVAIDTIQGFWGVGRMIDWSDPNAGRFIHDRRRFPDLTQNGVTVHWTDLGEPENFDANGCYEGVETAAGHRQNEHQAIHNIYNLLWNKSIWDGYFDHRGQRNALGEVNPRPFILTRSGAGGTQRNGAAMWSGDIASNLDSLASHANAQMHMSLSGIDYYGADVGGFRREGMPYNDKQGSYRGYEEELYTQWFANATWFDVPIRPHTDNEFVQVNPPYATSPHLVGKKESNLANLRERYVLIPYYYSLAYRAFLAGEAVVPPPVFYYQNDPNVRMMGHEKLIGRDVLVGIVARHGEYERDVYLPAGQWVDYYSNEWFDSTGEVERNLPVYRDGLLRLPAFVRSGAILPQMFVDEFTMDATGARRSGAPTAHDELIVKTYASERASSFTLYEDDGRSLSYTSDERPQYRYRTTLLQQQASGPGTVTITINPAADVGGSQPIDGTVDKRRNIVRLVVNDATATSVRLNGALLRNRASAAGFDSASSGWWNAAHNLIEAKSPSMGVARKKTFVFALAPVAPATSVSFVCDKGFTSPGESIYVSGSLPQLGSFDPSKAIKLSPDIYYEYIWNPPPGGNKGPGPSAPVWTGRVAALPPNMQFTWKCLKKREDGTGPPQFETGANHVFNTGASGYSGRAYGSF